MLLAGTSVGGFAYPSNCYAATESSSEQSIYSLANHYLKSSLSVMGNTCLEIKLDMKRRQIKPIVE